VPDDEGGVAVRQADERCGEDFISLVGGARGGGDGAEHPVLTGGDALKGDFGAPTLGEGRAEFGQFGVSEHRGAQGNTGYQEIESQFGINGGELFR
jgi:hypothetical protein